MFTSSYKETVESQSISAILQNGIQLGDVLDDMARETVSASELSASQQYIDSKAKMLERATTPRFEFSKKGNPTENALLGQAATCGVEVRKSWTFSSNSKKAKVASGSSKKKGMKKQKAEDYQDRLTQKMSAKFIKVKSKR